MQIDDQFNPSENVDESEVILEFETENQSSIEEEISIVENLEQPKEINVVEVEEPEIQIEEVEVKEEIKEIEEVEELNKIENYISGETYSISPNARSFKSYMSYKAITNTASKQYKMQREAYTDNNGLRKIGEYYCVAMGTYYGNLGDKFYVETDQGNSWTVIISDIKSDAHTDSTHRYTISNGCMMEFIVDTSALPHSVKNSGTVNGLGFQGNVIKLEKIN